MLFRSQLHNDDFICVDKADIIDYVTTSGTLGDPVTFVLTGDDLEQVKDCARRGVHILSMKIPTFDPKEYDEMIEVVEKADIICQIELEMHYNPVVKRLQKLIADGEIGKVLSVQATNITLSPVWAFPWQGVPEASYGRRVPLKAADNRFRGGALCDHPHIFDLIRWLTKSDFDFVYSEVAPNLRPDIQEIGRAHV